MPKEQVIAMVRDMGIEMRYGGWRFDPDELERFATLVGNAKLEEAIKIIDTIDDGEAPEYRACQEAIESLKEPTT